MTKAERNKYLGIHTEMHPPINSNNKKYEVVRFDSCDEMVGKMLEGSKLPDWYIPNDERSVIKEGGGNDNWTFGQLKEYDQTLDFLKTGQVLETVLKKAKKTYDDLVSQPNIQELLAKAETFKRKKKYSEEGAELCIDRVMSGDPAHWIKTVRGKKCPLVKLGMNIGGSAAENESVFNNVSAVCGVVADILSRAGFSVEINSCTTSRDTTNSNNYDTVMVCLKKAEEALDLKRIYSVGCSGYFRCWIFQVYWNILEGTPTSGLGYMQNVLPEMMPHLGLDYIIDSSFVWSDNNRSAFTKIENLFNEIISNQ